MVDFSGKGNNQMDSNINEENEQIAKETTNVAAPLPSDGADIENMVRQLRDEFKSAQDKYFETILEEEKKMLTQWQSDFTKRVDVLNKERADYVEKANELIQQKNAIDAELPKKLDAMVQSEIAKNEAERSKLQQWQNSLAERERKIIEAERARDSGFAELRIALDKELGEKKSKMNDELAKIQSQKMDEIQRELEKYREEQMSLLLKELGQERDQFTKEIETQRKQAEESLSAQRKQLDEQKGALASIMQGLDEKQAFLDREQQRLDDLKFDLETKANDLKDDVERLSQDRIDSIQAELDATKSNNQKLNDAIRTQTSLLNSFEHLKARLGGDDPSKVLQELQDHEKVISDLRQELANKPSQAIMQEFERMKQNVAELEQKNQSLSSELDKCRSDVNETKNLKYQLEETRRDLQFSRQNAEALERENNRVNQELARVQAAYESPADKEARYAAIRVPLNQKMIKPAEVNDSNILVDELEWLESIRKGSDEVGMHFNPRILKSFHTALKNAEWSPITVLAGVSGTGKSELPRFYSNYGGLNFEPVAVQPNWDCQESMLGFFNSIDNKFDAQEVLRFLAQSQKPWSDDYNGTADGVNIVLLDEMNLAHPELYFAEFLSKLEQRRGKKLKDLPSINVKVGAGVEPYPIPLGRNVLWVGTMNQDETTKSLSDKVLDRSVVIYFPRPKTLKTRTKLIEIKKPLSGLNKRQWQQWVVLDVSKYENLSLPYKNFVQKMNDALGNVGRAMGHRVWQSIEYYMYNYPDVRAKICELQKTNQPLEKNADLDDALHIAFEDQIVQKIMPKLRGIDTRGDSKKECLDPIKLLLSSGVNGKSFDLEEDFNLACKLGYGQFMWQSANYLSKYDEQ